MAIIDKLKNHLGVVVHPVTKTKAIYDDDGNRLDNTLSEISSNLTDNSKSFIFGYRDGKYGYYNSESKGADAFVPFKSCDYLEETITCSSGSGAKVRKTIDVSSYSTVLLGISATSAGDANSCKAVIGSTTITALYSANWTLGKYDVSNISSISISNYSGNNNSNPNGTISYKISMW